MNTDSELRASEILRQLQTETKLHRQWIRRLARWLNLESYEDRLVTLRLIQLDRQASQFVQHADISDQMKQMLVEAIRKAQP